MSGPYPASRGCGPKLTRVTTMAGILAFKMALFLAVGDDLPHQCFTLHSLGSARNESLSVGRSYAGSSAGMLSAFYGTALIVFRRL